MHHTSYHESRPTAAKFHPRFHPIPFQIKPKHTNIDKWCVVETKNKQVRLNNRPALHTNLQAKRLPQEALASLHRTLLLELEIEAAEYRSAHNQQLHLGDVAADAGSRAVAEGDEGGLLACGQTLWVPALGHEVVGVGAPDFFGVVDCVAGHGEDVAGAEGVAGDLNWAGVCGDLAGEAHGGGAVDAHCFPDGPLQARYL